MNNKTKIINVKKNNPHNNYKVKKKELPLIVNIFKNISIKNDKILIKSLCLTKVLGHKKYNLSKFKIIINDKSYNIQFKLRDGIAIIKKYRMNYYTIELPINEVEKFDIQNKVQIKYKNLPLGRIIYSAWDLTKGKNKFSKVLTKDNKSFFIRQTKNNTMYLTVRKNNKYDFKYYNVKLKLGYILSKIMFKKNIILLFEKEASRYEESASVLYEKLIDLGHKNVFYIIDKDNKKLKEIKEKYKKNLIYRDSLKHIVYFFKCNKFIGTESLHHALQLRIASKIVIDKINNKNLSYIFLQHGVMYMVSLNSDLRTGFRKMPIKMHKVVVSSELEAQHFIKFGGFKKEDLYICGLPKFDKAKRHDNADKIVIMLTWRRWEANQASTDYKSTKYYKMIKRIASAIPEKLKNKVVILPHPLMLKEIKNSERYVLNEEIVYDDVLKDCKLLITDYSSIAYDAYYRGSNVIFYWEEKDECIKKYGESATLLLNEKNTFADICYSIEDLCKMIEKNYNKEQTEENKNKFKKIVSFTDNKNTERLIEMLEKDKII